MTWPHFVHVYYILNLNGHVPIGGQQYKWLAIELFCPTDSTDFTNTPSAKCGLLYQYCDVMAWHSVERQCMSSFVLLETSDLTSPFSGLYSPLGAVGMAGMALVVGLCVLEDEAVGALQAIGTLFHTVRPVLEVEAFHAMLWALWIVRHKKSTVIFNLKT